MSVSISDILKHRPKGAEYFCLEKTNEYGRIIKKLTDSTSI